MPTAPRPTATGADVHQSAQISGAIVAELNRAREAAADSFRLTADEAARLVAALGETIDTQQEAFLKALAQMQNVRDFVGSPERILGSARTKHGEIAEQLEVALTNARDYMAGRAPSATFEGVGRTAPEDYLKAGAAVQSKFINGARNTLDHVLGHLKSYEAFGRDGSYYEIPRDQHDVIQQVLRGDPNVVSADGILSSRSVETLRAKLKEIDALTGRSLDDVVRPAQSDYSEVQQGVIHKTIEGHESRITADHEASTGDLAAQRDQQEARQREATEAAADAEKPTWQEAGMAAAAGAAVGGGLRATAVLWRKHKEGKTFATLTAEDWRELGVETAKGAALGGLSGGAIYLLTNSAGLAAPFAGAVVSSSQAVASLVASWQRGEISAAECSAMGQLVCAEGAFVACGTVIGQTLIPIPVVGAFIGSTASRLFLNMIKEGAGPHAAVLSAQLERQLADDIERLDGKHQTLLIELEARMAYLGDLTDAAFAPELNAQAALKASVALAEALKVDDIIVTDEDLDLFILGTDVIRAHENTEASALRSS